MNYKWKYYKKAVIIGQGCIKSGANKNFKLKNIKVLPRDISVKNNCTLRKKIHSISSGLQW